MYSTEADNGSMIPRGSRYFPVPPGSVPSLEWSVDAVGDTDWDKSLLLPSVPVFSGTGLETVVTVLPVEFPAAHSPVSMQVIHLLGTTLARVTVSPFCYGTSNSYAEKITYKLSVPDAPGGRRIESQLLQALCSDADVWWPYRKEYSESLFWGKPWARIGVKNTGFCSVTGVELEAAGCAVAGAPSASLSMFAGPGKMFDLDYPGENHQLSPVPIAVYDGGDGIFDPTDSLIFYGQGPEYWNYTSDSISRSYHRYADANTYWLTWGGGDGARFGKLNAAPIGGPEIEEGIVAFGFEQEVFWTTKEKRTGWIWGFLSGDYPTYFYLGVPFASDIATLRFSIINEDYQFHRVRAELEDVPILDTLSKAKMEIFTIDSVSFLRGGNLLKVWNESNKNSYFNYAEVFIPVALSIAAGYPVSVSDYAPGINSLRFGPVFEKSRIYDITDPVNPLELKKWTMDGDQAMASLDMHGKISVFAVKNPDSYLSASFIESAQPGRILEASSPADVIIIAPKSMIDDTAILKSVYATRGLSVFIATYREVYDEFGQGVSDPGAVRSLVRWALDTWPDPPEALLLVGDGSNDPLGNSTGYQTVAPVYVLLRSDECNEGYFTMVHDSSMVPEIPVSRIPASTVTELLVASEKAATLGKSSVLGPWSNTVMLAADDEWGHTCTERSSTENCEYLSNSVIPASVNIVKLYEIAYPWPAGTTVDGVHPAKPEASADFIEQLNRGVLYTAFFGHGSYDQMTDEKLFASSMINQLTNGPRYFLYNSFSCSNGMFDLSAGDCLAEIFLFHPRGGACATIACTRGSYYGQNETLSEVLMGRLHQGIYTVAEALWLSQVQIGNPGNYQYAVLGDGGITLPLAATDGYHAAPADTLTRGQINTVDVSFPEEASFMFRCTESADSVTYVSPLKPSSGKSVVISYLRYGAELYSSILSTNSEGDSSVDFFVPLQADTGSMARTDAIGKVKEELGTGFSWPIPLVDTGKYSDDSQGPEIELSFPDSRTDEVPTVYQNSTLHVALSDPSGICILGKDAGSIIIGSVDGGYEDLTELFTYYHGSFTSGYLDYDIPDLLPGLHEMKVVARDGMKNTGESILSFNLLDEDAPLLEKTGVYPNPGRGFRSFFFTTSSAGTVSVSVYTIAGRPVWEGKTIVQPGVDQLAWNGMDSDGDAISAGVYIYVIQLSGSSGKLSISDILVVSP